MLNLHHSMNCYISYIEKSELDGHKKWKNGANIAALRAKTVWLTLTTMHKSKGQYTSLLYG